MSNFLSPNVRRWGFAIIAVAGMAWLAFNPQYLFEDLEPRLDDDRTEQTGASPTEQNANFDFYVLALSWSPSFCASANRKTGLQCGGKRYYSFIVHGLWPQFEKSWPSFCDQNSRKVPSGLTRSMLDIMPDFGLVQQQWKKHGTCSDLNQQAYFEKLRAAYDSIRFPARYRLNERYLSVTPLSVEQSFRTENPGLPANAIAVTCGKRRLKEVRICFSKDLKFRACQQVNRNSCRRDKIIMPPVRGG